jgi:hypothetical protein
MPEVGKFLIFFGIILSLLGIALVYLPKSANPFSWLGRLPGDIYYNNGTVVVWIPLTTMILLGLLIRLVLWVVAYFR